MQSIHPLILLLLLGPATRLHAQTSAQDSIRAAIRVIGKSYRDSLVLRWAPDAHPAWSRLNRTGYIVERIELPPDKAFNPRTAQRRRVTVGPWSLEEWKANAAATDTMAAIAAQALYGKNFTPDAGMDEFKQLSALAHEQSNRHSFALLAADVSVTAARGLGLRFTDREVARRGRYIYRIYPAGPIPGMVVDTGYLTISADDTITPPAPTGLTALELERAVRLEWNYRESSPYFTGFYIERSSDGGKTFSRLNRVPLVQPISDTARVRPERISYADSLPANYRPYVYRVRGLTPFAELSPASKPVTAMGRDRTPPSEPQIDTILVEDTRITIRWSKKIREPDFAGFIVGRSTQAIGPYQPLFEKPLSPTISSWVDTTADRLETNYYVVAARDTAGNTSLSLARYAFIPDTIPPAAPRGLTGTIDSLGVVRLKWNLGPEPDIIGYRVFMANQLDHAFLQRTGDPVRDTTFVDTVSIATLTRHVFYRVSAVDRYFNTSGFSDPLTLVRPDTIAPGAPLITYVRSSDSGVYLEWAPSSVEDLAATVLMRDGAGARKSVELLRVPYNPFQRNWFHDTSAVRGVTYHYWLYSIDSSGLRSTPSPKVMGRVYDTGVRPGITDLKIQVVGEKTQQVRVTWNYGKKDGVRFLVYRRVDDYPLSVHASTQQREFVDSDLPLKGTYSYAVKVLDERGGASLLSGESGVVVR